ncbi:hypothetical protein HU200_029043 [Digitaria exilis]|uniref:PGG domain-containing protein n=1 Tax=Digitaria exilis TaxID=1010633 RepID=A0A835BUV9_9POAL|nr:hypothetical protein HU200_029043 [Digitaria exilis]
MDDAQPRSFLRLREGILLVAIQVVTMTYAAGLNPPGGVWADSKNDEHLITGNPILALTYHKRYNVFSSGNTAALMVSAMVVLLLLFVRGKSSRRLWFHIVLRSVLSLGMLALAVAYTAGASQHIFTTYASISVLFLFLYALWMFYLWLGSTLDFMNHVSENSESPRGLVSAIFVASMTYAAGLRPPGGFWLDTQDGHRAGDPALLVHYRRRFTAFFVGNTMAFFASLFITPVVMTSYDHRDHHIKELMEVVLIYSNYIAQYGLIIANASGSNMDMAYIAYVLLGGLAVIPAMVLIFVMTQSFIWRPISDKWRSISEKWFRKRANERPADGDLTSSHDATNIAADGDSTSPNHGDKEVKGMEPFFALMFTTISAAVTYQAGLNPPGGLWPDDLDSHKAGDPILLSKQPTRYRVFIYCNSVALVASLVAIIMSLTKRYQKRRSRALEGLLVLDIINLIGAYAAGCCRDVQSSVHVIALGGAIVVYVVFHMAFLMSPGEFREDDRQDVDWNRDLMLGILGATLTYQTGLNPPGGFWRRDGEFGHQAGEPVLLSTYPNRYRVFFYLNALCFMECIFLTIFSVNQYLYKAGIRCRALFICVLAVFFGLIGAYAAGSYRSLRPSIGIITLGAAEFILITSILFLVYKFGQQGTLVDEQENNQQGEQQQHDVLEYLVLIGSIGATVTNQAGFAPPRSFWPDDSNGHAAGNPVLRDKNPYLYRLYFFCNTTAFLASWFIMNSGPMVNVMDRGLEKMKEKQPLQCSPGSDGAARDRHPGCLRGWNNSFTYAVALVAPVLFIIFLIDRVVKLVGIIAEFMKKVSEE